MLQTHHNDDHHYHVHGDDDFDDGDDSCLNALNMAPAECLIVCCSNEVSISVSDPPAHLLAVHITLLAFTSNHSN